MRCYNKTDKKAWQLNKALGVISCFLGKNGVTLFKQEGDCCTPAGLFLLSYAFGNEKNTKTKMPFRMVTKNSYWVDDPTSVHYNHWVEGWAQADWASAEHLAEYPNEYAYAVVIEYNTQPVVPHKGSAIFLHCGTKPTAGCIAVPEDKLLQILSWLDPDKSPRILIPARN